MKNPITLNPSGETEAGNAEEQPARDNRTEGNDREELQVLPVLIIHFLRYA